MTRDAIWQEFNRRMDSDDGYSEAVTVAWFNNMNAEERAARLQREQTAATIFAALLRNTPNDHDWDENNAYFYAVRMADGLRAALEEKP